MGLTPRDMSKSLFLRTTHNMYELLERLHLEPDAEDIKLSKYNEDELKRGINGFIEAMILISKNSRMKKSDIYNVPFICHEPGNC